ncbi:MAG: hypothetical protein F6K48_02170 [Okeania sp. SIO3H1]|uniref:hypothetical protein n=1 Tax=Okeania sp. SIO1I7 TaxID=2607772 RepID=UPI0013C6E8AA|nr:hypothetical protein [Okeania sp. SIO1I7]NEN87786.1 hypothetical protein [Okeania sp. SIO3H1]NET29818.1 hypothetical protein [Okeania sp. SIO1I7]
MDNSFERYIYRICVSPNDINLDYLGVNPPLTPPRRGTGVRSQPTPSPSQEGKKEEERAVEGESFLVAERGTEFYRALLRILYHTSNHQRLYL